MMTAMVIFSSCINKDETPRAKHVIFLGFDAMSAIGIQRAETPNFNRMIENGAISLQTRCVRETSSSQNWMSMVCGAPIEMHGVIDNDWKPDNYNFDPATRNKKGLFPTMFDFIKEQRPEARMEAYIEWADETRMYDMSLFDKTLCSSDSQSYNAEQILDAAFSSYLENEPELLFVSIDLTDHAGHAYGHESQGYFDVVHRMDERVGEFVNELESRGMMDDAVIIITADHGGLKGGHGGDSMAELEVPVLMYGKGVTKGKVMEHANMIYDNAATVCGLLGVKMAEECRGKFMMQAFEPKTDVCYVPAPLIHPFSGVVPAGETVSFTLDAEGAEIYYSLDGSVPTKESLHYTEPFTLSESSTIQAVAYKNGTYSRMTNNFLYASTPENLKSVQYKLYKNYEGEVLPDFTKFGKADATGAVSCFTLDEIPVGVEEDDYAIIFSSNLVIKQAGKYMFELTSDDGSRLIIDDKTIINNDGSHSTISKKGSVELAEGVHVIKVEYFEDSDGQELEVHYAIDGEPLRPLLSSDLQL